MPDFDVCLLSPLRALPQGALAAARAGHPAVVDLYGADPAEARTAVGTLVEAAAPTARFGLRLRAADAAAFDETVALLDGRAHWLILAEWTAANAAPLLARWADADRQVGLEITGIDQIAAARAGGLAPHGFVGRGSETGGVTGRVSSFVLAQALAAEGRPFLMQGGIGLHSAVACRAAGAAGVILDDQWILTAESPLAAGIDWRPLAARTSCSDTAVAGADLGWPVRVTARADVPAARALLARAAELAADTAQPAAARTDAWRRDAAARVAWGDPAACAWPAGESAGLARAWAARYPTCGRLLRAFADATSDAALQTAAAARPFAAGSALARAHGTRYPIVQGPMTRVSDRAAFAEAVAGGGALPLLALALLNRDDTAALLRETAALAGTKPWGVGILGFVPPDVRDAQMAAIREVRPPFALIAGGRPDQAAELDALGIDTYLHAPDPELLRRYLAQGARRFVFEGSECGGHTGPVTSFTLWDQVIDVLLHDVPAAEAGDVHVLFAGGIHDARSTAMVSVMAAPLAARGMKAGVLMGTAYLFTREIVGTGAVVDGFQREALTCARTVTLTTAPGHAIRCAPTPFADAFEETRHTLAGLPAPERAARLEHLTLGRSRVASKGLQRQDDARLEALEPASQRELGMYMMGEVAALRSATTSIADLHREVSDGSSARLDALAAPARQAAKPAWPSGPRIAIVGMSCLVPGAGNARDLWQRLLAKRGAISEIPEHRFDWRLYFDADPQAADRIYSRWGGFLDEIPFDPRRFGIPPRSLKSISVSQLLTLEAASRALDDAGYASGGFDRDDAAVIVGMSTTADLFHYYITRSSLPLAVASPGADVLDRLPTWTEESFPGLLLNVTAGRVANRLDLGGPNYAVDAACASSLAAVQAGVRELESGRSSLAIVAGVELDQTPYAYLSFSRTRALSPTGTSRPFDRKADGIVISEGIVALVLKRLDDAERDGDRIYSVLRAVEGSSDGRALGLTAPRPAGQRRALARAYDRANLSAADIQLYEAHGTGTVVGDRAELETIASTLRDAGAAPRACAIGSAKSLLGHTKAAAGMVGLVKASLALHHRTLPPHAGVDEPLDPLLDAASPLKLLDAPQPWLSAGAPRRAGVSAFGFGGTNFHAIVEEYADALNEPAPGADAWPAELFVFRGHDREDLDAQLASLAAGAARRPEVARRDAAWTCALDAAERAGDMRLAIVVARDAALADAIDAARVQLAAGDPARQRGPAFIGSGTPEGTLALLFPGQGSQYPGMARELAVYLAPMRRAIEDGLAALPADLAARVADAMWPAAAFGESDDRRQRERVTATEIAQPAIGLVCCGLLDTLHAMGLRATAAAGHSYGELMALHAAGALDRGALVGLSGARGAAMGTASARAAGAMAAVAADRATVIALLADHPGVTLANHNAPDQCVISGAAGDVARAIAALAGAGIRAVTLPVGSAFHSPLMAAAGGALHAAIAACDIHAPSLPVFANLDGRPYPDDRDAVRQRLFEHLERPVEFVAQIEAMYEAGVRTFVEAGPRQILTSLVGRILEGRPHTAVALDRPSGLAGFLDALAALHARGDAIDARALFAGRRVARVDWKADGAGHAAEWFIDGGHVRHRDEPRGRVGAAPVLTAATSQTPAAAPPHVDAIAPAVGAGDAVSAYQQYQHAMREFLAAQEKMLMQVLDRIEPGTAPRAPVPAVPEPAAAPARHDTAPAAPAIVDAAPPASVHEQLVALMAERTGYPADAFGPDVDLEAELGVDSIKRIEILGRMLDRMLGAGTTIARARMDRLTSSRTLRALTAELQSLEPAAPAAAPGCPRYTVQGTPAPLPDDVRWTPAGLVLVTEDTIGVAALVRDRLMLAGARAVVVARQTLAHADALREAIVKLQAEHGPVRGVVHLAPIAPMVDPHDHAAWRRESGIQVKGLFEIVKRCASGWRETPGIRLLAVTPFGGSWRRDSSPADAMTLAVSGGVHGLARTVALEMTQVAASTLDVDPFSRPDALAEIVYGELTRHDGEAEAGYQGGIRTVYRARLDPIGARPGGALARPEPGWVVLITGGARGITNRVAKQLAQPGVRLVVVGRSAAGDVRDGLDALSARGASVEYHAVDVRDAGAFGGLIDGLYERYGRIDAVVHGAGVIEDRRIEEKTRDAFDRVFDTKADSAWILRDRLRPEGLRWVALFSSVTGRLGNLGQCDYAAANEVLNRIAWEMSRAWPATRVRAIGWGPWRDGGMVGPDLARVLEARGFQLIDPDDGLAFFATELDGAAEQVEVLAGAGPFEAAGSSTSGQPAPGAAGAALR